LKERFAAVAPEP
jgi:hypothetical protein